MLNRNTLRRPLPVIAVGVLAVALIGGGTAAAQDLVTSKDVKDNSLRSVDVKDGSLRVRDLTAAAVQTLQKGGPKGDTGATGATGPKGATGAQGPKGDTGAPGLTNLESDGPYPGATNLQDGDNSTAYWTNNGLQRSWVMCAPGKVALGGGFTAAADASDTDKQAVHIVTSQPAQIVNGNPDAYTPIEGDADGSYVPNGWLVEGYYTGTNPALVVRPHVVCANITR